MLRQIESRAADSSTTLALLAPGRPPLTYGRLYAEIRHHARTLRAIGIGKQDCVALLLPNGPEAAVSFLASSAISICAPLNPISGTSELDLALSTLKPKALIVSPEVDPERRAMAEERGVRVLTATPHFKNEPGVFSLPLSAPVKDADDFLLPQPNEIVLLLHTSGTTSRPKLVGLTHGQLRRSAKDIVESLQLNPEDRCLNVMPLFHIHGIVAALLSTLVPPVALCAARDFKGATSSSG